MDVLVSERLRVQQALVALPYAAPESQGNFVWLPLAERAEDFGRAYEAGGVVVRPFAGDGVRVTIGEPHANDRWIAVLRDFLGL